MKGDEKVVSMGEERALKEAWVQGAAQKFMSAGMLVEEAEERARQLAADGWKNSGCEDAASDKLRQLGWCMDTEGQAGMPIATTPMPVVGFDE